MARQSRQGWEESDDCHSGRSCFLLLVITPHGRRRDPHWDRQLICSSIAFIKPQAEEAESVFRRRSLGSNSMRTISYPSREWPHLNHIHISFNLYFHYSFLQYHSVHILLCSYFLYQTSQLFQIPD